jgi:hypothetical protein
MVRVPVRRTMRRERIAAVREVDCKLVPAFRVSESSQSSHEPPRGPGIGLTCGPYRSSHDDQGANVLVRASSKPD